MNGRGRALRLGEFLIRRAVSHLPARVRHEWFETFAAELPAILDDPAVRPAFRRQARMLLYAADTIRGARLLRRSTVPGHRAPTTASVMISVAAAISVGSSAVLAVGVITTNIHLTLVFSEFVFGGVILVSVVVFIRLALARARRAASRDDMPLGGA